MLSSNFNAHKHDPSQCDLIVCWKDNLGSFPIPRLALSSIVKKEKCFIEKDQPKYTTQLWSYDTYFAAVPENQLEVQSKLYEWASSIGSIRFGNGDKIPSWVLNITHPVYGDLPVFGVYSEGKAWPGFLQGKLPVEFEKQYREYYSKNTTEVEKSITGDYIYLDLTKPGNYEGLVGAIQLLINFNSTTTVV